MGSRSRKRRRPPAQPRLPRVRGEARDALIRARLEPLAAGERPRTIAVAVAVAILVAIANVILYAAGYDVPGQESDTAAGTVGAAGMLLFAAFGMWRLKSWGVLIFQCLLAITAVFAGLALLVASNLQAVLLSLVVLGASGTLFWFLVRVLSRIQTPQRPAGDG